MQKIVWLASWYPSRISPFDGDFIKRHAIAVSLVVQVTLIHVVKDVNAAHDIITEEFRDKGFHEIIVYYKPVITISSLLNKILSYNKFTTVFKRIIRKQISENGVPDLVHVHVPMRAGLIGNWLKKIQDTPDRVGALVRLQSFKSG